VSAIGVNRDNTAGDRTNSSKIQDPGGTGMLTENEALEILRNEYRPVTMDHAARAMYWVMFNYLKEHNLLSYKDNRRNDTNEQ
jgi:hypothetical protein